MAEIVHSARAADGIERALRFLLDESPDAATLAADAIATAVEHLARHPLVGRRVEGDLRELVISFGATGHIALYRYIPQADQVRVLALRSQREIGYLP